MRKIDIHTHILPEIDDGASDWVTSLEMLVRSAKCGIETVIATPHYLPWTKSKPSAQDIRNLCAQAREKLLKKHGIAMDIYPGNEIYYSVDVIRDLKAQRALTLADSRYVLVEFEFGVSFQVVCRAVRDFLDGGYIPIIAHIERYPCLGNLSNIAELKRMGAMTQMNVSAFQGGIFDADSRFAKSCLKSTKIDFIASDMHDLTKRPAMSEEMLQWIYRKVDPAYQRKLFYENGQKILLK